MTNEPVPSRQAFTQNFGLDQKMGAKISVSIVSA
jgi:hypothetical protein